MSTVIHAGGHGLVAAADFLSPYDFFRDLTNPALAFLPRALLIAVVAALVCGSVGVHVVLRGMASSGMPSRTPCSPAWPSRSCAVGPWCSAVPSRAS